MGEERKECIDIIKQVQFAKTKKEIIKSQNDIFAKLHQLPNFRSDMYEPLSLAIQLLTLRKQDLSLKRQYVINILLAISGFFSATVIGILQLCRSGKP